MRVGAYDSCNFVPRVGLVFMMQFHMPVEARAGQRQKCWLKTMDWRFLHRKTPSQDTRRLKLGRD